MASALPGVKVGPLDPETTADFGSVGKGRRAQSLLRRHQQLHPLELRKQLRKVLNTERTLGVDLDEVRENVELPASVPDGSEIIAASVRGQEDSGAKVLCYAFRTPRGRVGKWFTAYDEEAFPKSVEDGDRRVAVKDAKEAGVPFGIETSGPKELHLGGARGQALERRNRELRRQLDDLTGELAKLRQQLIAPEDGGPDRPPQVPESEEPFEGYDALKADEIVARLRDEDDQALRDAVAAYERANKDRKSVVAAAEQPAPQE